MIPLRAIALLLFIPQLTLAADQPSIRAKYVPHNPATAMAISEIAKTLVTGDKFGSLNFFKLSDPTVSANVSVAPFARLDYGFQSKIDSVIQCVGFSPDGSLVAAGSDENTVCVYEKSRDGYKFKKKLEGHSAPVTGLAFLSADRLVSCSVDGTLRVWEISSDKSKEVELESGPANALSIDASNKRFAIAHDEPAEISLWNTKTLTQSRVLQGHEAPIDVLSFSSDSRTLVSGDIDGVIKVWSTEKWEAIARWSTPGDELPIGIAHRNGTTQYDIAIESGIRCWDSSDKSVTDPFPNEKFKVLGVLSRTTGEVFYSISVNGRGIVLSGQYGEAAIEKLPIAPNGIVAPLSDGAHLVMAIPTANGRFFVKFKLNGPKPEVIWAQPMKTYNIRDSDVVWIYTGEEKPLAILSEREQWIEISPKDGTVTGTKSFEEISKYLKPPKWSDTRNTDGQIVLGKYVVDVKKSVAIAELGDSPEAAFVTADGGNVIVQPAYSNHHHLMIYDLRRKRVLKQGKGPVSINRFVALKSKYGVIASSDEGVVKYDVLKGKIDWKVPFNFQGREHTAGEHVSISADQKHCAVGFALVSSSNEGIIVVNIETGSPVGVFTVAGDVSQLQWFGNSKLLIRSGSGRSASFYLANINALKKVSD